MRPAPPEPRPEGPPSRRLSEHDRVNNTNALELLQSGTFKLVPGKDSVPYEKLMTLRLEDGIDVTRKVSVSEVEGGGKRVSVGVGTGVNEWARGRQRFRGCQYACAGGFPCNVWSQLVDLNRTPFTAQC